MGNERSNEWYVKIGGRVCGPLTIAELESLARRGAILRSSPASRDRRSWGRASELPDLASIWSQPRPATAGPASTAPAVGPNPRPVSLTWHDAGAVVAKLFGLLMTVLVVGNIVFRGFANRPGAASPAATAPQSVNPVSAATRAYWMALKNELSSSVPQGPQGIGYLVTKAGRIESLPVLNVDPDLLAYSLQLTELLQQVVQLGRRQNDPSILIESFVRGAAGDPLGTTRDQLEASRAIQERASQLQYRGTQLRAVLSQRYGVELPAL